MERKLHYSVLRGPIDALDETTLHRVATAAFSPARMSPSVGSDPEMLEDDRRAGLLRRRFRRLGD